MAAAATPHLAMSHTPCPHLPQAPLGVRYSASGRRGYTDLKRLKNPVLEHQKDRFKPALGERGLQQRSLAS